MAAPFVVICGDPPVEHDFATADAAIVFLDTQRLPPAPNFPAPTQSNVQTALASFLRSILPRGQCAFNGAISGDVLTIASVVVGAINVNDSILGERVAPGTFVQAKNMDGTFKVYPSQNSLPGPTPMSTGVQIIEYQDNRVPQPPSPDFIILSTTARSRIATNRDESSDCSFTASIAGDVMTVSAIAQGKIQLGAALFGFEVMQGSFVLDTISVDQAGLGTYKIAPSPQTLSSRVMAAGAKTITESTKFTVQIDVHGPNAANFAQLITTTFRDEFAVDQFANQIPHFDVVPLHADEPRQIPFQNAEQQWETRWVVEAMLEAEAVVSVPQQYMDAVKVQPVSVEAEFPPTN